MDPAELLSGLSRPEAFPEGGPTVEVVQTHISIVFLTGARAYKVKKTLSLWGLLDYSTIEARRALCEAASSLRGIANGSRSLPRTLCTTKYLTIGHPRACWAPGREVSVMERAWFRRWGWIWRPVRAEGWFVTLATVSLCGWVLWAADRHSHSVSDTLMGAFPYAGLFVVFWGFVAMRTQSREDSPR